jgi:PleD family two-component response regulator
MTVNSVFNCDVINDTSKSRTCLCLLNSFSNKTLLYHVSAMAVEPILIVDDNQLNLKLTRILLEKNGFVVHTAGDGTQALTLLEEFT